MGPDPAPFGELSRSNGFEYFEPAVLSTGGVGSEILILDVYVDPHLIVLLFLFGLCVLYALIVAVDALYTARTDDSRGT